VQEKKDCSQNERYNPWCVAVVRWPGCPAEHRGSLDLLVPPFASRQKVEISQQADATKKQTHKILSNSNYHLTANHSLNIHNGQHAYHKDR
jgi:hypothetical protein